MLGRQQIAGIPTAVSEVFKNAYDAYATEVRGDYFPDRSILTIRDDGIGMSVEDFTNRWLTIGTESKSHDSSLPKLGRPAHLAERRQMGEKGIGRLAIATIGPQLVVLTRGSQEGAGSDQQMVVSLVQWTVFEVPGITLDEVVVPIRLIDDDTPLNSQLLREMAQEVRAGLEVLGARVPREMKSRIESELDSLDFEIEPFLNVRGPNVREGHGTTYIVSPLSPDVAPAMELTDSRPDQYSVSDFQRFLLGFTDSISSDSSAPNFDTSFVRHDSSGTRDLIDRASYFWDDTDFEATDHLIEGSFDDSGTFQGAVSIYKQEPTAVLQEWREGRGRRTNCGPFRIKFGYVQGKASESRLDPEDFAIMTARLEKLGGLYVYRDGIRVLPYGNADFDYLEIEKRRTLNAATYYFSYRRMFGAIQIDSSLNAGLQEKAGREGFRENAAYRDFRDILKAFLIQIAATYFSSKGQPADDWRVRRQELSQESRRRREQESRRQEFDRQLSRAMQFVESGQLTEALSRVVLDARDLFSKSAIGAVAMDATAIEASALREMEQLVARVTVPRPVGLALTAELEREWTSYQRLGTVVQGALERTYAAIDDLLTSASGEDNASSESVRAARLDRVLQERRREIEQIVEDVATETSTASRRIVAAARAELETFDLELGSLAVSANGLRSEMSWVSELESLAERHRTELLALKAALAQESAGPSELAHEIRLEERILDLEEQVESNLELLQLGQAVQIISHEFEASIRSVRTGLRQLEPWAKSTPRLQAVVRDLQRAFSHLDGYLRLFTPLQRRLYREETTISGGEIETFLRGVFAERLSRHGVVLEATQSFRDAVLVGYPSTFFPAFVNLVDNSIHWLSGADAERKIVLDESGGKFVVQDTGPGVQARDVDYIFERGFSRRRGGRGLGLSLARDLLARDRWSLVLEPSALGAKFVFQREENSEED